MDSRICATSSVRPSHFTLATGERCVVRIFFSLQSCKRSNSVPDKDFAGSSPCGPDLLSERYSCAARILQQARKVCFVFQKTLPYSILLLTFLVTFPSYCIEKERLLCEEEISPRCNVTSCNYTLIIRYFTFETMISLELWVFCASLSLVYQYQIHGIIHGIGCACSAV